MPANFLGKSKPINFIVLFSFFVGLFVMNTITLFNGTSFNLLFLLKIISFLILFLAIFFFYNFIVSKNNLTFDNSYAFYVFTIIASYFLPVFFNFKTLITLLIYFLFLRKIYSLKSSKDVLQKLFDAGFWLSILFILEPFSALFSILIYGAIWLHQKPIINNLIAPIVGFITPLIIYFTYCFWVDKIYLFVNLFYRNSFKSLTFFSDDSFLWILTLILSLSIISIILKSPKAFSVNNSFKKNWILLIINLSIALIIAALIDKKDGTELLLIVFPASVIIANGLEVIQKKFIKDILLVFLFLSAIVFTII